MTTMTMKRSVHGCLRWLSAAALCLAMATPALAGPPDEKDKDKEGWSAVSRPADMNPEAESVPAAPLVAGAYGFIWVAVLVYVGTVAQRARRLQAEVDALRKRLPGGAA